MSKSFVAIVFLLCLSYPANAQQNKSFQVHTSQLKIEINAAGEIVSLETHKPRQKISLRASTRLSDTEQKLVSVQSRKKSLIVTRQITTTDKRHSCLLTETFTPEGDAIRWETEITGQGKEAWGTGIQTHWQVAPDPNLQFWTTWGDPRPETAGVAMTEAEKRAMLDGNVATIDRQLPVGDWADPLVPQPLLTRKFWYGGSIYGKHRTDGTMEDRMYYNPFENRNYFSVPVIALLNKKADWGVSMGFSPENIGIEALLWTRQDGKLIFDRQNNRISPGKKQAFTTYLYVHEPDWRAALGWYVQRFKSYFDPVAANVHDFAGTSAYSWEMDSVDFAKMKRMAFKTNWDATFPFLYMGQFLPPVGDTDGWLSWRGKPLSFKRIDDYYARMQQNGCHVLSYFDMTEFGNYVLPKTEYVNRRDVREVWMNCNKYLWEVIEPAVVYQPYDTTFSKFIYTYEKTVVVDCAEPVYKQFMLEQARRHVDKLPHFEGIAIDRMDWNRMYNMRRDDGVAWFNGKPCRSLHTSWNEVMDTLGRFLHANNKVIFINNHIKRLEQTRHADGVFDEFGDGAASINANAFLCVNKPLLGWCHDKSYLGSDFDAYMQRYLHLGMFPMAPFPANDHAIQPDPEIDQLFMDYGELMKAMEGKNWVLEAGAVEVADDQAKVNIFQTPDGWVVPVTFGKSSQVKVKIKKLTERAKVEYIQPGQTTWQPLSHKDEWIDLPLHRNCAVLRIR